MGNFTYLYKSEGFSTVMIAMCLGWKAQRICPDVIAAAESMRYLEEFFAELCTKVIKHILILATAAVTHGIPKKVGK